MAVVVDVKSSYKGEQKVRNAIEEFFTDDAVVYNNREVNGREYDICLLVKDVCVFIVEVKGWLANKIKVHGVDEIEVEGYEEWQTSPKKQAKSYCIQYFSKIKKQFGSSPLVIDLVAYPFITKEEYYSSRLDIISEEQFTIFEDDLQDQNSLKRKFQAAFDAKKGIPHAELNTEFLSRIRRFEEPSFDDSSAEEFNQVYSELSIFPNIVDEERIKKIITAYFKGIKQILFVSQKSTFDAFLRELDSAYKKENIEPGDKIKVGYKKGVDFKRVNDLYRTFNFEIYLIEGLGAQCGENITIEEGKVSDNAGLLSWIANHSNFNFQQYCVEHASPEKNTLVEAGAGTGKTHSMVSRVAYLCNKRRNNISCIEDELAMVTFTNDAAINMKKRLKQMFVNYYILTGKECYLQYVEGVDRANISTIHKFSLELLRSASFYTGLGTTFRISSDEYGRAKIYDLYLSKFLEEKEEENSNFISEIPVPIYDLKKKIIGIADRLLQKSVNLADIKAEEMGTTIDNTLPYFNEILQNVVFPAEIEYLSAINEKNAMDLKECIILLNQVLAYGADNIVNLKLRYLFIDEFQDTDDVQIETFQKLQKYIISDCRLFVVGDLKQSIYRFRGARLSAFDQLKEYKKYEWEIFHLNINYRTDARLLDLYDSIFQKMGEDGYLPYNKDNDRLSSEKIFESDDNELLQCVPCHGKDQDVFFDCLFDILDIQTRELSEIIKREKNKGNNLSIEERTIAILVRSNWQTDNILKEAKKRSVTIRQLLEKPEVQDIGNKEIIKRLANASAAVPEDKLKDMIYHNFIIEINNDDDEYEIQLNNIKRKRLVAFLNNETIHDYMMRSEGPIERIYSKVAENSFVDLDTIAQFKPEDFIVSVDLYDDMQQAGADPKADKMARALMANDAMEDAKKFSDYLNQFVEIVIQRCAGIEPGDFEQVFMDIRKELYRIGKNLTLFIEDVTSFTGNKQIYIGQQRFLCVLCVSGIDRWGLLL